MRGTSRCSPSSLLYKTSLTRSASTLLGWGLTVPTGTLQPVPLLAPRPGASLGGTPLAGELKRGDLWGDPDEELDGVAGHLVPHAGDPLAGDPHTGDCLVFMPNILAALSKSESESRNLGDRLFANVASA